MSKTARFDDQPLIPIRSIGIVRTPFTQRFGIPRQPGLASSAKGVIELIADPDLKTAIKRLDEFSHLWVIFLFHDHGGNKWKPTIRPPRLGGKEKVGVLSSRSPHRPNPIGLSAVKLDHIEETSTGQIRIHISGVDLLDQTPVLDIKPYLPYADSIPDANPGWAHEEIKRQTVIFTETAQEKITVFERESQTELLALITDILELDPRPAFQKRELPVDSDVSQGLVFGVLVKNFDVHWKIENHSFVVFDIFKVD